MVGINSSVVYSNGNTTSCHNIYIMAGWAYRHRAVEDKKKGYRGQMYKYFVAYGYTLSNKTQEFGNIFIHLDSLIRTKNDIDILCTYIERGIKITSHTIESVFILNFILMEYRGIQNLIGLPADWSFTDDGIL